MMKEGMGKMKEKNMTTMYFQSLEMEIREEGHLVRDKEDLGGKKPHVGGEQMFCSGYLHQQNQDVFPGFLSIQFQFQCPCYYTLDKIIF